MKNLKQFSRKNGKILMIAGLTVMGVLLVMSPSSAKHQPATATEDQAAPATVEPRAAELLRAASDTLVKAGSFRLTAEVQDSRVMRSGAPASPPVRTVELKVRRPDKLFARVSSDTINRDIFYDGASLTLFNRNRNFYGTVAAPGSLDETIDFIEARLGFALPLGDLVVSDPYGSAMANVRTGRYIGQEQIQGVNTHHLAFTQESIDWEVWVEDGATPLIRKVVIHYKKEPDTPEYTALLRNWELNPALSDQVFNFQPPADAKKIDIKSNQ